MSDKILLYGRWCTGKTRQAAHLIEKFGRERVFIVSCDDGLKTIAGIYAPENVIEARSVADLRTAWGKLVGVKRDGPLNDAANWLVFDGLTAACEWIEDAVMDALDEVASMVARGERAAVPQDKKAWLRFVSADGGPDNQRAYGPLGTDCKLLIDTWSVKLPCNVYTTAHEQESQRDRVVGPPYTPKLPGKVAREHVMGKYDYVIRMVAPGTAQLDPEKLGLYWSRTRENREVTGALEREYPKFNLGEFVEKIRGPR